MSAVPPPAAAAEKAVPVAAHAELRQAVQTALDDSAAGWTAGDLDRFMQAYEDSPDTIYLSNNAVVRGKAQIQAMYAERFGSGKAGAGAAGRLGTLGFELIEIRPIGPAHALVLGRYKLRLPDPAKPEATGVFTLVFHRSAAGWRIVADHSS